MKYLLTEYAANGLPITTPMEIAAGHQHAWRLGSDILYKNDEAVEMESAEYPNKKLIIRIRSKKRLIAKIESL